MDSPEDKTFDPLAAGIGEKPNHADVATIKASKTYRFGLFKVDVIVTGFSVLIYLMSFLDKANLGNAAAAGLRTDLNITSYQYSVILTLFFVPYILAEYPVTWLMKKVGPHRMLPGLCVAFGLVTALQGLVTSYSGLIVCRIFLAFSEGGVIPSLCLYLSLFFPVEQYSLRCTLLFSACAMAGAFAGLFAAAILNLDGVAGKPGWAYIFIIEGALTIAVGIPAFFLMTPSIEKSWWLRADEKEALRTVYNASSRQGEEDTKFSWSEVASTFKHPFAWLCPILNFTCAINLFGMAFFLPTIVRTFGYSPIMTQLRTVPPWVVVFFVTVTLAYFSDKKQIRGPLVSFYGALAIIGIVINLVSKDPLARYAGIFFWLFGGYGTSPAASTWLVDNAAPHYARGTQIAWCFTWTQIGGIASTWLFPGNEAPYYPTAAKVSLAAAVVLTVLPWIMVWMLKRTNKQREEAIAKLPADHVWPEGPISHNDIRFRYLL